MDAKQKRKRYGRKRNLSWLVIGIGGYLLLSWVVKQTWAGTAGATAFQFLFLIVFQIVQFVTYFGGMMYFLSSTRTDKIMPGDARSLTLEDYRGQPVILEKATQLVSVLNGWSKIKEMGGEAPRGLLLIGGPGTGKTYLAQCLAGETEVPYILLDASGLVSMWMGMGSIKVMRFFGMMKKYAKRYGACVAFLDEVDAIGAARGGVEGQGMAVGPRGMLGGGGMGVLNTILSQMDGLDRPPGIGGWFKRKFYGWLGRPMPKPDYTILVIASTNRPSVLDAALTRSGRFDLQWRITPPTESGLRDVVEYYLDKVTHIATLSVGLCEYCGATVKGTLTCKGCSAQAPDDVLLTISSWPCPYCSQFNRDSKKTCLNCGAMRPAPIDTRRVAASLRGATPADIRTAVQRNAVLRALAEDRDRITESDILLGAWEAFLGVEMPEPEPYEADQYSTAAHEAGHIVACLALFPEMKPLLATIIPHAGTGRLGPTLGLVLPRLTRERQTLPLDFLHRRLLMSMAGREAGALLSNNRMGLGFLGDRRNMQGALASMIMEGAFGYPAALAFGPGMTGEPDFKSAGKETQERIDEMLVRYQRWTCELLEENREVLEKLTGLLLEEGTLDAARLEEFFDEYPVQPHKSVEELFEEAREHEQEELIS